MTEPESNAQSSCTPSHVAGFGQQVASLHEICRFCVLVSVLSTTFCGDQRFLPDPTAAVFCDLTPASAQCWHDVSTSIHLFGLAYQTAALEMLLLDQVQ